MSKKPAAPVQTREMPSNITAAGASRVEPITGAKPVAEATDGPGFIAGVGGPGKVDDLNPNATPGLGPQAAAEALQGSAVQNAPDDPELAELLKTPEGQQLVADRAAAANEAARVQALEDQKKIIANAQVEPLSPKNAYPGQPTITMESPSEFYVLLQDGRRVQFKKGVQEVCEGLAQHSYVLAHKVLVYEK